MSGVFIVYNRNNDRNFEERIQQLAKETLSRNRNYEPVFISYGSQICNNWWGAAWCRNLERYADWENRIERGKNYLRMGAVVDLKINGGRIISRVQGVWRVPYLIQISIDPLSTLAKSIIGRQALGKIQNLEALVKGTFPEELKELFFQRSGLFPSPQEIHFNCNCPDEAIMCKHVAATLFATGAKVDKNPLYFFQMRNINVEDFIAKVVVSKVDAMLEKSNIITPRIIKNANLAKLFGI